MENETKTRLTLTPAALHILARSASPRKRGELVSKLLTAYGAGDSGIDQIDVEGVKLQIMGLASANKTLEGRVMRMERQVSALMAGVQR